jgi:hypothetical protein
VMKVFLSKDWVKVFLAFAALMVGALCLFCAHYFLPLAHFGLYCLSVLLLAGGCTYFWMNSRFYKR